MRALPDILTDFLVRKTTFVIFGFLLLYFGLQAPAFLTPESLANIVKQASFVGIAAIGMTFVLLTGGIDLSVGSVMFLAPLIAGYAMRELGVPVPVGLLIALLTGIVLGALNALLIVRFKVLPFITTLATLFLFRGFGTWLTSSQAFDFPETIRSFGLSTVYGIPTPIIVFAIIALFAHVVLSRTEFGRQVYAFGNSHEGARKGGLNVQWIQARVYIICSACAALSGFMLIAQIGRLDAAFAEGSEFDVIAAAVLGGASLFGGVGSALGAVVGATLILTVKLGLIFLGINLYMQPMLQGIIIFIAVFFDGIREKRMQLLQKRTIRPLR